MCDIMNLLTPFLQIHQHQFASFSPFCNLIEDESYVMNDKRKYHGAVDKCLSEQLFRKSNVITFAEQNFWSHTPIATRSYHMAGK